jgi:hypothetical protein
MLCWNHRVKLLPLLVSVLLSGCGTSGLLVKEQEIVIVEKVIEAAIYHPQRPPEIRPPPTDGAEFFKAVNAQVVGAAFLSKISEVYSDPKYFEAEDLAILMDAAVEWMGTDPIPDAFLCMGDPQLMELEIWMENVKLFVSGAERSFSYYESLE